VHSDLELEGYEVQAVVIPAAAVNAPHGRDRVWFVATNTKFKSEGSDGGTNDETEGNIRRGNEGNVFGTLRSDGNVANSNCDGFSKQWRYDGSRQINARCNPPFKWSANSKNFDNGDTSTNIIGQPTIAGRIGEQANVETNQLATAERICGMDKECDQCKGIISNDRCENVNCRALVQDGCKRIQSSKHRGMDKDCGDISSDGTNECEDDGTIINRMERDVTNPNGNDGRSTNRKSGCEESKTNGKGEQSVHIGISSTSNEGDVANTEDIRRKDALENGELEGRRFRFGNKPPTWDSFPSQSPICGGDDGIPAELDGITFSKWRNESIKAYGNAIVPQVAYQIFKAIQETI